VINSPPVNILDAKRADSARQAGPVQREGLDHEVPHDQDQRHPLEQVFEVSQEQQLHERSHELEHEHGEQPLSNPRER